MDGFKVSFRKKGDHNFVMTKVMRDRAEAEEHARFCVEDCGHQEAKVELVCTVFEIAL